MSQNADSFSTYIDHLILLLTARFQAPIEATGEEDSETSDAAFDGTSSPWGLVSRALQQALSCPLTPQERSFLRQFDVLHFTPAVCRERARYIQWRLQENQQRRQRRPRSHAVPSTPAPVQQNGEAPYDVTRDSLRKDVLSIYALVRRSLPSTLDDTDSEEDGGGAVDVEMAAVEGTDGLKAEPSTLAGVQEFLVRTAAEVERDACAARARDEFLSQVQALQSLYYEKYHRWMDVPASVLDPPPTVSATSSNTQAPVEHKGTMQGQGIAGGLRGPFAAAGAKPHPSRTVLGDPTMQEDNLAMRLPNVASMLHQVRLQRPPRPSAVSDDVLESMYRAGSTSQERSQHQAGGSVPRPSVPSDTSVTFSKSAETAVGEAAAVALPRKDTAPPVSRRNRWQVVEYDDDDDKDD